MPLTRLAPLVAATAIALGSATAHAGVSLKAQVDAVIAPLMKEHDIAGMAVAVFANGQAQYFSYGVASKAGGEPVSADTLFEIGSLSKTYTATLAALASAEGRLDLQAPARRYQPALAGTALGEASVLELGAYSADCLPLQFPDEVQTDQQALAFLRNWQPRSARGTQRCYSNPSLGLFGDLAARAQKRPRRADEPGPVAADGLAAHLPASTGQGPGPVCPRIRRPEPPRAGQPRPLCR